MSLHPAEAFEPGSVSPFGVINDRRKDVIVIVIADQNLKQAARVNLHSNFNTATVGISATDFERFLVWTGHPVRYFQF